MDLGSEAKTHGTPLIASKASPPNTTWNGVCTSYCGITVAVIAMGFSLVYVLYMQISDSYATRATGTVFAFFVQVLLFGWCFGIEVALWRWKRIDHVKALGLVSPILRAGEVFTCMSYPTIVAGIAFLAFLCAGSTGLLLSLCLWAAWLLYLAAPQPFPFVLNRCGFMQTLGETLLASFGCIPVEFIHTWVADGLTSACLMIFEMSYSICCYAHPSVFADSFHNDAATTCDQRCGTQTVTGKLLHSVSYAFPFVLRLLQEIRQRNWLNAGKYLSCLALIATASAHAWAETDYHWDITRKLWVVSAVVKTSYCYIWDIRRDWGLWQSCETTNPSRPFGLREGSTLSFDRSVYYVAMVTNLIGRVSWTFAISPSVLSAKWHLLLALVEISRRGQWNVLRIENRELQMRAQRKDSEISVESDRELMTDRGDAVALLRT